MIEFNFGKGSISVTSALEPGAHILVIEEGLGVGEVGATVPGREAGKIIDDWQDDAVILRFRDLESLDVVIERLEDVRSNMVEGVTYEHLVELQTT